MTAFGGLRASLLTNYDITFWMLLLSAVSDGPTADPERRPCTALPWRGVPVRPLAPEAARALAALNLLLISSKVEDDACDSPGWKPKLARAAYGERFERALAELERQGFPLPAVTDLQRRQSQAEADPEPSLDSLAEPTATALAEVFAHIARILKKPELAEPLGGIGRALGGYLYLWDALVDLSEDQARGQFNAFARVCGGQLDDPRVAIGLRRRLADLHLALTNLALGPEGKLCFSLHASLASRLTQALPKPRCLNPPTPRARLAKAGMVHVKDGDCCEIDCCECGSCCDCNLCDCNPCDSDKHCCELNCCSCGDCCCGNNTSSGGCCSSRPSDQVTCCFFDGFDVCCLERDYTTTTTTSGSRPGFWERMRQSHRDRRLEVEVKQGTRRRCPACELPMVMLMVGGVEVDECRNCGGVWLDEHELDTLARLASLPGNLLHRYPTEENATRHRAGTRTCPACQAEEKLVVVPYLDVPVEMCKACSGFWFDHGALARVLRAKRSPKQLLKGHKTEWRCPYCEGVVPGGRDVCERCGAPRPSSGFTGKLG